jgi:hypothetical protein
MLWVLLQIDFAAVCVVVVAAGVTGAATGLPKVARQALAAAIDVGLVAVLQAVRAARSFAGRPRANVDGCANADAALGRGTIHVTLTLVPDRAR